jgi:phosphatidylserine decarboxylase
MCVALRLRTKRCLCFFLTQVSPADGIVLTIGRVRDDHVEQVKGVTYSLDALLGYNPATKKIPREGHTYKPRTGNAMYSAVIYLAPGDYHRFHSPTEWKFETLRHFAGMLCLM